MSVAVEVFLSVMLVVGGLFGLVGSFGLLKLKRPMQRLHGPTKAVTMGVATALIAAAVDVYVSTGVVAWQNVMIAVFLFLTAPISALYIAKAQGRDCVVCAAADSGRVPVTPVVPAI